MVISFNDAGTYPLVISRMMLEYICLSPLQSGFIWRSLSFIIFVNIVCVSLGNVIYMFQHITDFAIMGSTCSTVSANIQIITKIILMNYFKKDLAEILNIIDKEFWPANITDKKTERSIRHGSRKIVGMVCVFLSSAFLSVWDFGGHHLVAGRKILPMESSFPFDWRTSPRFEIITIWQFVLLMYPSINTIATHDFFLNSLVSSCIAQFKLLQTTLLSIGTGKDLMINSRLDKLRNLNGAYPAKYIGVSEEYDLIAKCIEHHNKIIDTCAKIQRVYGMILLLQFFLSALSLCVSTFVLTQFDGYLTRMLSFALAHLMQFFFLCATANELIYESIAVADAAYCSMWYNTMELRIRSALTLIIQRAHREVKITAAGFANLDYPSFVNVLRFSFSFYTLLGSLEDKRD